MELGGASVAAWRSPLASLAHAIARVIAPRGAVALLGPLTLALVTVATVSADARPIEIAARTTIAFDTYASSDATSVVGVLRDNNGARLPRRPVLVAYTRDGLATAAATDTVRSGREGEFRATRELDPGTWQIEVLFEGDAFFTPSEAAAVVVVPSTPPPAEGSEAAVSDADEGAEVTDGSVGELSSPNGADAPDWTRSVAARWVPPIAAVFALLLLVTTAVRTWLQRRRAPPPLARTFSAPALGATFVTAVDAARDGGFEGRVVDAEWAVPIVAFVRVGDTVVPVDANGVFEIPRPLIGERLRIEAPGYEPLVVLLAAPPQGDGVRFALRARRTALLELWQALLVEVAPRGLRIPGWWGRETVDHARVCLHEHVRSLRHVAAPSPIARIALTESVALALESEDSAAAADALGRLVEDRYFGSTPTSEEDLALAARLASLVRRALVVLLWLAVVAAGATRPAFASVADYRIAQSEWYGLSSFARVAASLGATVVEPADVDLASLDGADVLWIVYPTATIDVPALVTYVAGGGTIVVADDFGTGDALGRAFQLERAPSVAHSQRFDGREALFVVSPLGEHPLSVRVQRVVTNHPSGWRYAGRPVFAFDDDSGLLYDLNLGQGRALFLSDPSLLTNLMLPLLDNRVLVENLLTATCPAQGACRVVVAAQDTSVSGPLESDGAGRGLPGLDAIGEAWARLRSWSPSPPTRRALEVFLWVAALIILSSVFPLVAVQWRGRPRARVARLTAVSDLERSLERYDSASPSAPFAQPLVLLKHGFERTFYAGLGLQRPSPGRGGSAARRAAAERWVRRFGAHAGEARRIARTLDRVAMLPDRADAAAAGMRLDVRTFRRYESELAPLLAPFSSLADSTERADD